MQQLTIAGNVGKDSVLRRTQNGDAVLGFSIAVDQGKDQNGNKRETLWVDCSLWGKRAEKLEAYIKKGTKLVAWGRPTVREHAGKAYLGLSVDDFTFMGGTQSGGQQGSYGGSSGGAPAGGYGGGMDDEIPW